MSKIASVVKVTTKSVTLESDDGQVHEFPVEKLWESVDSIKIGQIFRWNDEDDTLIFDEKETKSRRGQVASLLAMLKRN